MRGGVPMRLTTRHTEDSDGNLMSFEDEDGLARARWELEQYYDEPFNRPRR